MRRDIIQKAEAVAFRPFSNKTLGNRLGFRFADGRMKSLPYVQLVETEFNPAIGIVLEFVGHRVTIAGRNLVQLYWELEAEEVGEVCEQHDRDFAVPAGECVVTGLHWERLA